MNSLHNSFQISGLKLLSPLEQQEVEGGLWPLLVVGVCALVASCQSNRQDNNRGKVYNIQYHGNTPDTTIIRHGDGSADTIIHKR